jgi:cytochrome b
LITETLQGGGLTVTDAITDDLTGNRITVWDWPVRLVHWVLVLLLPALWWTGEEGKFTWHMILGVSMLGLLVFRVLWGFVGSRTARFASFVRGPRTVAAYFTGEPRRQRKPVIGHNPLGGWSVLAMLALLICQVSLGLVAGDPDDSAVGPLNHLVSYTTANTATGLHELLFNIILALVGLHVAAVLVYLFIKADNLIMPMITGRKAYPVTVQQPPIASALRVLLCSMLAAGLASWLYAGAPLP